MGADPTFKLRRMNFMVFCFQKIVVSRKVIVEVQIRINYLMIYTLAPIKYVQLSLCDVQQLDVYINPVNVDNSRDLSSVKTHATNGLSTL